MVEELGENLRFFQHRAEELESETTRLRAELTAVRAAVQGTEERAAVSSATVDELRYDRKSSFRYLVVVEKEWLELSSPLLWSIFNTLSLYPRFIFVSP